MVVRPHGSAQLPRVLVICTRVELALRLVVPTVPLPSMPKYITKDEADP